MPPPNSVSTPDSRPQLHAFVQWFTQHGIAAWNGTPAELSSELSKISHAEEAECVFRDSDKLFLFLESNAATLSEFGVDASVHKSLGQRRSICLRSTGTNLRPVAASTSKLEVRVPPDEQADGKRNDLQTELTAIRESLSRQSSKGKPKSSRWLEPRASAVPNSSVPIVRAVAEDAFTSPSLTTVEPRKTGLTPVIVLLILSLVGGSAFLIYSSRDSVPVVKSVAARGNSLEVKNRETPNSAGRRTTENKNPVDARSRSATFSSKGSAKTQNARDNRIGATQHIDSDQVDTSADVDRLIREATEKRFAASQYELGIRYSEGRGLKADRIAAYAWLVLARANGDSRSEETLKSLTKQVSPTELQQIRMLLGDWYARGLGVQKDDVIAHSWYSLAESAGSSEATVRKQRIESRMSAEQIRDAETRTTAWLRRH